VLWEASQHQSPTTPRNRSAFIDAAREAEADETEEGADRAFKKIVPK
jgi:hypothetical protein